jgi:short-subunit dehydrogenase
MACARVIAARKSSVVLASRSVEKLNAILDEIDPYMNAVWSSGQMSRSNRIVKISLRKTIERYGRR